MVPAFSSPVRNFKGGAQVADNWGSPRTYRGGTHAGLDIRGAIGTPIYAVGDGVVTVSKDTSSVAGKMIVIEHAGGFRSRYLHLNARLVQKGDQVSCGQQIAELGRSGIKSKEHLHFDFKPTEEGFANYKARFGTPEGGFIEGGVPAEHLIPIVEYSDKSLKNIQKFGLNPKTSGGCNGMSPLLLVGIAVIGYMVLT